MAQVTTFDNIYITGDKHGDFSGLMRFCDQQGTTRNDLMIVLGDAGINYYRNGRDLRLKEMLAQSPITLLCVHGNHEERPENISTYTETEFCRDTAYYEPKYPNLIFAKDGSIYKLNGAKTLILGGAYSVDKYYRLMKGWNWFESEQITDKRKAEIEQILDKAGWSVDYVLSHTCPYDTRPTHLFLRGIDQSLVDSSMEVWFQKIADRLDFKHWYFGHYHDDWDNGKYSMLYGDIEKFPYEPADE